MALDMYLDPDYAELIIEVNKLKLSIAEKIAERGWLSVYVLPEIRSLYNLKLGVNEAELFLAKLNLDKIKRKVSIYEEYIKYGNEIDSKKIDKIIDKEFKNQDDEYASMQEEIDEAIELTSVDKISQSDIQTLNYLYEELIMKLCPLLNLKNTKLENGMYEIVEEAYKDGDLKKMISVKMLCNDNNINSELEIDDFDNMKKTKEIYQKLLDETRSIILNIRASDIFSNRTILKSEILLRRKKDSINDDIHNIMVEYDKYLKKLEKLLKKK